MSAWNDHRPEMAIGPGDVRAAERDAAIAQVSGRLAQIVQAYADLAESQREEQPDTMADLGHYSRLYGKLTIDEVTEAVPAGPIKRSSGQPPVSGSREQRAPVDLDVIGLTGTANAGSVLVAANSPWPEDQIGHIAVQSELDFWACDWASRRGETPPAPSVADLCAWLDVRLEWAHDEFPAWDEMATALDRVARALRGTLTPRGRRSVPVSAPCPQTGCEGVMAVREDASVECECGRVLSAVEYRDWALIVIAKAAGDGWGITAREIQLTALTRDGKPRPLGTIHSWASRYRWTKAGPGVYSREQARRTVALIEAREAEEVAHVSRVDLTPELGSSIVISSSPAVA